MQLSVGDSRQLSVSIGPDDVERFAALSGDTAPLHTDVGFAKRHGFAGCLVHGALLGAVVSRFVGTVLPGPLAVLERVDLAFRRPCVAPCTVMVTGRVRQVSEAVASIVLDITIAEGDAIVATGRTWHKWLNEPAA